MKFKELQLSDRDIFDKFLASDEHYLSTYHFDNIFIWRQLFIIFYAIIDGYLCIFFKDRNGCFMYLPPLDSKPNVFLLRRCFEIMDEFNINKDISRIENVQHGDINVYREYGHSYSVKSGDYLCARDDIASLAGSRFKSKRASYNYFIKHYDFEFRPFCSQDKNACLSLYQRWAGQRKSKFSDFLYEKMLEECFLCHKVAVENFAALGLIGYVVKVKDEIVGYTFGYPLNSKIFCVLFEICDLTYRGISQFIFSRLCQKLPDYQYINIMDDSYLENLKRVKLSYRPIRIVSNYIINRPDKDKRY